MATSCKKWFWLICLGFCSQALTVGGQELPASWRIRVAGSSSAELAEGYLITKYKLAAATQAISGNPVPLVMLDDQPLTITKTNAPSLVRLLDAQLRCYEVNITDRGYPELLEAYLLVIKGDCGPFEISGGPVLLKQEGFELQLWQNGVVHRGAIVESAIAFEHNKSPEIRFFGELTENSITLKTKAIGFAKHGEPVTCSLQLTPVGELSPELGAAYLDRAVALLDLDDYANAQTDLDRAIELNPKLAEAWSLRSQLRAVTPDVRFRNGSLAVEDAKQACELTYWKHWQCLAPLACAYAEAGNFDLAISTMENALTRAPHDKRQLMLDAIETFRRKKPMRYALHTNMSTTPISQPSWMNLPERPNVTFELIKDEKSKDLQKHQLRTSGLKQGEMFQIWMKGLSSDWSKHPDTFVINESGVMEALQKGRPVPLELMFGQFLAGESSTLVLVSEDKKYKVTFAFTPRPLSAFSAETGYGLEAELLDAKGKFYHLKLTGFEGEQEVRWYCAQLGTKKEVMLGVLNPSEALGQPLSLLCATAVFGKSGDLARFRFVGEKGEIALTLPWGDRISEAVLKK
jgi:tetratricopeptide (TPR) repeat protein